MAETAEKIERGSAQVSEAQDDDLLAISARDGNSIAFENIFDRHKRRVARLAGRFFNRPETVEEIVQDVFTKVYFSLGGYKPDPAASFSAWVSRITINACYDQLRKSRRRPEGSIDLRDEEISDLRVYARTDPRDAEAALISRDLAAKLLDRIRDDDRIVLTLLEAEEMPVAEIAKLMGWSVSKVKVRAHRARAALRRVLGELV